jgi:putative ABC transport system permease protein
LNRVAVKGLLFRRGRTALIAIAIVIGVALVSGTYVLTDTVTRAFNSVFSTSYAKTSAVISGKSIVSESVAGNVTIPESLVRRVRALPGVQAATGAIFSVGSATDRARLLDRQGRTIGAGGAPSFGFGFEPAAARFNPLNLTAGHWASGDGEVVIDKGVADRYGFELGQRIGVSAIGPVRYFTISGIATFGSLSSLGSTTIAVFTVPEAQRLLGKQGRVDAIFLAARPGFTPAQVVRQVRPLLPPSTQVRTGAQQAKADSKDIQAALRFIQYFLLAFAGLAVLVGAFVTFNTISITVAQRLREFATLRSLGASRRQVLLSVVVEGLFVGALASALGLFAGLGLAKGLESLFGALGASLPTSGTVFASRTVLVSLLLGTGVTVVSSLVPALHATQIPPIAAMREGATLPPTRISRRRGPIVAAVLALGAGLLAYGSFGGLATLPSIELIGGGCLAMFVAAGLGAAALVRPLAGALGEPARRFGGEAGRLAGENATRNPVRTARTASALMVGLALVTVVATLGAGLRASERGALESAVRSDYVVTSKNGFEPFPAAAGAALPGAAGATLVSSVRYDEAKIFGRETIVNGVAPNFGRVFDVDWEQGSAAAFARLGANGAVVERGFAADHRLRVGSRFRLLTASGRRLGLRVAAVWAPTSVQKIDPLIGKVVISSAAFDRSFPRPSNIYSFVDTRGGATTANTAALERALRPFPDATVYTKAGWVDRRASGIDKLLNLLYVLLALSVIVSLFGMVNTLVLSVFERTREIGMLRAVGMTRRQVRRMVRQESVITALIGAGLGLPLGVLLAAVFTRALSDQGIGFSLPVRSLVAFTLVAILAGIVAAVLPARRAARLDVLRALHYE